MNHTLKKKKMKQKYNNWMSNAISPYMNKIVHKLIQRGRVKALMK